MNSGSFISKYVFQVNNLGGGGGVFGEVFGGRCLNLFGILIFMKDLLEVQPFEETLNSSMCGPASLKMVLSYYGVEKSESELAELCGTDPDLGTSSEQIKKVAANLGFIVEIHNNSTFNDIEQWIDKKVPVIVNWFTRGRLDYSGSEVSDGHFSVVVGLDEENIYLQDPEIGKLRNISRDDFMSVWFDFTKERINSWEEMIIRQLIAIQKPKQN